MSVNGRAYDWEDITVTLPHGEAAGITEIKYEDGQEITARYGRGSIPRSYGRGNYEASGSMVLDRDEWEKLKKELTGDGGGIYDHTPFTIVVSYANDDMGAVTDTLKNCKITKFSGGGGALFAWSASITGALFVLGLRYAEGNFPRKTTQRSAYYERHPTHPQICPV